MDNVVLVFYLVGLLPKLAALLAGMAVVFAVLGAVYLIIGGIISSDTLTWRGNKTEGQIMRAEAFFNNLKSNVIKITLLAFLLFTISSVIPSKENMYMMLAAKTTEIVVTSEKGQQTLDNIIGAVDHQLCLLSGLDACPSKE